MNKQPFFQNLQSIFNFNESLIFAAKGPEEIPPKKILELLQEKYAQSYSDVLTDIFEQKKQVLSNIFGSQFCLFEKITTQPWDKTFFNNFSLKPNGDIEKKVFLWGHIFTQSDWYQSKEGWRSQSSGIEFWFDGFDDLLVEINNHKYHYGERFISSRTTRFTNEEYDLRIQIPTIVLDSTLCEKIFNSIHWQKVLENIHVLHTLSSHMALIGNFFQEQNTIIQEPSENPNFVDKLRNTPVLTQNQYALNFKRLQKSIFQIAQKTNPGLLLSLEECYQSVELLTKHWQEDARDYVRFIAKERYLRLHQNPLVKASIEDCKQYIRITNENKHEDHYLGTIQQDMIHTENGEKEGIVFHPASSKISQIFTFAQMAGETAKYVRDFSQKEICDQVQIEE